jgi:hypothetical protein
MSQNTSHAVMAQRHEAHDSLDFFPTPPWATRALCELLAGETERGLSDLSVWEPACGEGHMARPLAEYFGSVFASDVHNHGYGDVVDFLFPNGRRAHFIVTNPPFRLAQQFVETAWNRCDFGAAMLVRTAFLESIGRYRDLFNKNPPRIVAQFSERVPMFKGRVDRTGSTATAYCWIIWHRFPRHHMHTEFRWIPPCRERLERPGDYD